MFKKMSIGKKLACGFGVVLLLLVVVGTLTFRGVSSLGVGVKDVIVKNELNESLIRKEIDHLNWANAVTELLTNDQVTELNVQTDDHLCAFGKWLFSDARAEAEQVIPELAPILKEIEGYHENLHTSAIGIKENFRQADVELPGLIAAREVDHLNGRRRCAIVLLTKPINCRFRPIIPFVR